MTIDDRYTVDLSDIRGVRFECHKCGAAITFRQAQSFRVPHDCPGCHMVWMYPDTPPYAAVDQLTHALRMVAGEQAAERKPSYRLCLEIDRPTK